MSINCFTANPSRYQIFQLCVYPATCNFLLFLDHQKLACPVPTCLCFQAWDLHLFVIQFCVTHRRLFTILNRKCGASIQEKKFNIKINLSRDCPKAVQFLLLLLLNSLKVSCWKVSKAATKFVFWYRMMSKGEFIVEYGLSCSRLHKNREELEISRAENSNSYLQILVVFKWWTVAAIFSDWETKKNEATVVFRQAFMSLKAESNVWHRLFNWAKGETNSLWGRKFNLPFP